jgi:hypothetical protein
MMMQRTRVPVGELVPGDIVQQHYQAVIDGKLQEDSRTVVIGKTVPAALPYNGHVHAVTRVTGLDPERAKEVVWVAVPDQHVTVVR